MKKGFTLIELLVVVLIIAILAAVALPQYTAAVEKSRATEAMLNLQALSGASNRYVLANDSAPDNFNELDISLPNSTACTKVGGSTDCVSTGKWQYLLYANSVVQARREPNSDIMFESWPETNTMNCLVKQGGAKYNAYTGVCKSLTGKTSPYSTNNGSDYYTFK
ncbi:prepilin-type N-terminal cleavage/methylation domain-containing protein [Parelusimicrobium proximum]|uniref:type IV pilin protein n=1 Tax=Parelusimicrobium proximum TaxID=3228953 RepID=UPI003D17FADB